VPHRLTQPKSSLDLALVGNCTWGGLIDARGRLVWACMPRFDSDPVFCALLQNGNGDEGVFAIELENLAESEQQYVGNTAILRTILRDSAGGAIEIRDFAPRFKNLGRTFRPTMLVRRIQPLAGEPRIRIVLRPLSGYGASPAATTRGSNHIRFVTPDLTLRLTTDAPVSYVMDSTTFVLQQPISLVLDRTRPSSPPSSPRCASSRTARGRSGSSGLARSTFHSNGRSR